MDEIYILTRILHIHESLLKNFAYMDCDPRGSGTVGSESNDRNPQLLSGVHGNRRHHSVRNDARRRAPRRRILDKAPQHLPELLRHPGPTARRHYDAEVVGSKVVRHAVGDECEAKIGKISVEGG